MTMLHPRNNTTNRYPLFKEIFNNVQTQSLLDWGGNTGNLLHFSKNELSQENYTCVDTVNDAIISGKAEFPNATWIHYNKFNPIYNPLGNKDEVFPTISKFDNIWSYSVFSHTSHEEFRNSFEFLNSKTKRKLAVSFLDKNDQLTTNWFYQKRITEFGSCVDMSQLHESESNVIYIKDNDEIIYDGNISHINKCNLFIALYDVDWLINSLTISGIEVMRPGNGRIPFIVITKT